ncbi:MAG: carboxymuconolactone decarboxylase family protein [Acidimicrobiia bacterium]
MARIEPLAWDDVPAESRRLMEAGTATGMYTTTMPLQVIAYSSVALKAMHEQYDATFNKGVLEPRLVELLRLHSAAVQGCGPCGASRKDDSITEDDVACLMAPNPSQFTPREYAALCFYDKLDRDHHSINDDTFRDLATVFSTAEIIEMAYLCSNFLGGHRLMHTFGFFSADPPIIAPDPTQIDRSLAETPISA